MVIGKNILADFREHKTSIKLKFFITTLVASSLISIIASYFIYVKTADEAIMMIRRELIATAATAAATIDGDMHKRLELNGNEKSQLYLEIKKQLKAVKKSNPKIRFIYTMAKTNNPNTFKFIVDAEDNPDLVSHLGDTYDVSEFVEMKQSFKGSNADYELTKDKWGTWLSGYAPIYNSKGQPVAIVGLDMSANDIGKIIADLRKNLALPLLLFVFMPPIISLFLSTRSSKSLISMINAAKKIADGHYEQRIPITTKDEIGELAGALNHMASNISERVGSAESMAIIDGLTDLYNHRYFQERLTEEVKRAGRLNRELTLLVVDIDRFAKFNEVNGHELGDAALKQIAGLTEQSVGNTGTVTRYAGEEFAVILPEISEEEAVMLAQRINMLVSSYRFNTKHNISMPITISIGISQYPKYAKTGRDLINSSYEALHEAKHQGTGKIVSYDELSHTTQHANESTDKNRTDTILFSAIFSLANAVDAKDQYTREHSEFVARYAVALGNEVGLSEEDTTRLSIAALLHDIGKIGIPDSILRKPGTLTDADWDYMKQHPILGANIISNIDELADIEKVILHHHERYDGSGYPDGMKGEEIPFMARIITVADTYHAMISDRPYRKGLSQDKAISELIRCRGSQFDPQLIDKFIELLNKEKLYSSSDGAGVVDARSSIA